MFHVRRYYESTESRSRISLWIDHLGLILLADFGLRYLEEFPLGVAHIVFEPAKSSGSRVGAFLQETFLVEKELEALDSDDMGEASEDEDEDDICESKELINWTVTFEAKLV